MRLALHLFQPETFVSPLHPTVYHTTITMSFCKCGNTQQLLTGTFASDLSRISHPQDPDYPPGALGPQVVCRAAGLPVSRHRDANQPGMQPTALAAGMAQAAAAAPNVALKFSASEPSFSKADPAFVVEGQEVQAAMAFSLYKDLELYSSLDVDHIVDIITTYADPSDSDIKSMEVRFPEIFQIWEKSPPDSSQDVISFLHKSNPYLIYDAFSAASKAMRLIAEFRQLKMASSASLDILNQSTVYLNSLLKEATDSIPNAGSVVASRTAAQIAAIAAAAPSSGSGSSSYSDLVTARVVRTSAAQASAPQNPTGPSSSHESDSDGDKSDADAPTSATVAPGPSPKKAPAKKKPAPKTASAAAARPAPSPASADTISPTPASAAATTTSTASTDPAVPIAKLFEIRTNLDKVTDLLREHSKSIEASRDQLLDGLTTAVVNLLSTPLTMHGATVMHPLIKKYKADRSARQPIPFLKKNPISPTDPPEIVGNGDWLLPLLLDCIKTSLPTWKRRVLQDGRDTAQHLTTAVNFSKVPGAFTDFETLKKQVGFWHAMAYRSSAWLSFSEQHTNFMFTQWDNHYNTNVAAGDNLSMWNSLMRYHTTVRAQTLSITGNKHGRDDAADGSAAAAAAAATANPKMAIRECNKCKKTFASQADRNFATCRPCFLARK